MITTKYALVRTVLTAGILVASQLPAGNFGSMDFFPTILELAGLPAMPQRHADGVSLLPLL